MRNTVSICLLQASFPILACCRFFAYLHEKLLAPRHNRGYPGWQATGQKSVIAPLQPLEHPWPGGHLFHSPGGHFTYRVIGPCCRLYDRDELPWPCCRLQWRGKEPSWRRIGRRFVVDLATQNYPSYSVEICGLGYQGEAFVLTLYSDRLPVTVKNWWHTKRLTQAVPAVPMDAVSQRPLEASS